ncbi:hypothetical protein BS50DRAFT_322659 [Corynespora cassiicola Philippines]|uniref:Uncharacterized protein n=1 Tax=Corynespora cassiicola Philippines TaxID=1448308 RepID=A0A2T2NTT5_CORCC|nr:hypothetical protein BS50DRAFT_322659 [Corynespora cassiicola Philippines]
MARPPWRPPTMDRRTAQPVLTEIYTWTGPSRPMDVNPPPPEGFDRRRTGTLRVCCLRPPIGSTACVVTTPCQKSRVAPSRRRALEQAACPRGNITRLAFGPPSRLTLRYASAPAASVPLFAAVLLDSVPSPSACAVSMHWK